MKKLIVLLVFVAFMSGLVFICSEGFARERQKAKEEKVEEAEKLEEPKVVVKFKTQEEMTEFEQLYIAKQATFGRMGVLQAYFAMEQNNLQEIDRQMKEKFDFTMDMSKMYDLNRDTMEIREMGPIPQQDIPVPPAVQQ